MSVKQQLITAEAFFEMPDPPDTRIELVDGTVREKPPLGVQAGFAKMNLLRTLGDFVKHNDLGIVLPGLGCVLERNPDTVRIAESCFIAWDRVPPGPPSEWFWEGAPTLAVEVVSHVAKAVDVHSRISDFLEAGSRQVWVVWPGRSAVSVYRPNADTRELGSEEKLDGGDVLPGFLVRVGDLFDARHRR